MSRSISTLTRMQDRTTCPSPNQIAGALRFSVGLLFVLAFLGMSGCSGDVPLAAEQPDRAEALQHGDQAAIALGPPITTVPGQETLQHNREQRRVLISGVGHIRQLPDFCGEACAAMWLNHLGVQVDQDYVFDQADLDPALARGCHTAELARALKRIGFQVGPVWLHVDARRADTQLMSHWQSLLADLARGVPSILCMHYDDQPGTTEHFRLILGYDPETDQVIYHEPAMDQGAYLEMPRSELLKLWPLKYDSDRWTLIRLRLESSKLPEPKIPTGMTSADFAQHLMKLRRKIPGPEFNVVVQPPFVVIGDEPARMVKHRAEGTIQWAVDMLRKDFFKRDPDEILDIWLFQDKASYEKHALALFGARPTTPFGYYSPTHRSLVMNISTGGGTLVHEIVHPFMRANFPACPAWFNEGLASLYEQCGSEDGHIHGYTNWRLAGLQRSLKAGTVPSFESLLETTTDEFYRRDQGTNYAQARYLCYYLQEQDKLVEFYRKFAAGADEDPTGVATLKEVLETEDLAEFYRRWSKFVLKLEYK